MRTIIQYIVDSLRGHVADNELQELAYWIVEELTGLSHSEIVTASVLGKSVELDISRVEQVIQRLKQNEPIQYIFGHTSWLGLDLDVEPSTLIPRPETSELVEWVMQIVGDSANLKIMDIGTGSGCIAIAIKRRCPQSMVMALDISAQALQVAQRNAARYGVDIIWQEKDVLTSPLEQVDVIVSNPPYICDCERTNMDARVLDYEPATALFVPDDDPLLFYRRIAEQHAARMLFFEINEEYGQEVCEMLSDLGYIDVIERTDIYGKTRMVFGRIAE